MNVNANDIFHVHTYRCGHAQMVPDEAYIQKTIEIGASGIWFTDHAPFPGDPFGNRMNYTDLDEYLESLSLVKQRYADKIAVHIGLEIEYFPSFDHEGYYKELRSRKELEILLLGQHMAETTPGNYTFAWSKERLAKEEYLALGNAQIQGMESGYFDAVAHPDRIFRGQDAWSQEMAEISKEIIEIACKSKIPLEVNESSKKQKKQYWQEFWELASEAKQIHGLDAHSRGEIRLIDSIDG